MRQLLKTEFCREKLGLSHHKPQAFCESQWRWPRPVFPLYRLVVAGYAVFALSEYLVTVTRSHPKHNVMVFLTTWTFILETVYFVLGAALALLHLARPAVLPSYNLRAHDNAAAAFGGDGMDLEKGEKVHMKEAKLGNDGQRSESKNGGANRKGGGAGGGGDVGTGSSPSSYPSSNPPSSSYPLSSSSSSSHPLASSSSAPSSSLSSSPDWLPWYVKVYWVVSNMIQVFALVVTGVYFGALYRADAGHGIALHDLNVHGVSSVLLVLDVLVCARPVRLLHALHPLLYGLAYVVFSTIYWAQDREENVLYKNVLDWNVPGVTVGVIVGLCCVGLPLLQLFHFAVFRLRLILYARLYGEKYL